ncbi:hypothetical protein AB0B97_26610 [Micromonospora sp. NPDC049004]
MTVNSDTFERATGSNRATHRAQVTDGDLATPGDRVIDFASAVVIAR